MQHRCAREQNKQHAQDVINHLKAAGKTHLCVSRLHKFAHGTFGVVGLTIGMRK